MHFDQPLGQIVLINVNKSTGSNPSSSITKTTASGSSFCSARLADGCTGTSTSSGYEDPNRLMLLQQQKHQQTRFTSNYERPALQRNPAPTNSVCSDGNSVSDAHSTCSSSNLSSSVRSPHSIATSTSPSSSSSSPCRLYCASSVETLPEYARSAVSPSCGTLVGPSTITASSTDSDPYCNRIALRQRLPYSTVTPSPPSNIDCIDSTNSHQNQNPPSIELLTKVVNEIEASQSAVSSSSLPLTDLEIQRIELFYRGQRTLVFVATGSARLLFTRAALSANRRQSAPLESLWTEAAQGIPVLLLDKGGLRTRSKRQLRLCLADRKSAFPLFIDRIDHLSDYKSIVARTDTSNRNEQNTHLHVFYLSHDHRKMAGLRFVNIDAGQSFLQRMHRMTSIPANISLTGPKATSVHSAGSQTRLAAVDQVRLGTSSLFPATQSSSSGNKKRRLPKKSEISSPCLFQHLTSLDHDEMNRLHQATILTLAADCKVDLNQPA